MGESTTLSLSALTLQHQESTWEDQRTHGAEEAATEEVEAAMIVEITVDIVVVVVEVTTDIEGHLHLTTDVTITDEDQGLDLILHVAKIRPTTIKMACLSHSVEFSLSKFLP